MPSTPTDCLWHGGGHTLPASVPGRLLDDLENAGLLPDPKVGFGSRLGEWAALREWTLSLRFKPGPLGAERIFLCAQGVRGRGVLRVNKQTVRAFDAGDLEIEITAQTVGQGEASVELVFAPDAPRGTPPRACIGIDGAISLRGVSQLCLEDVWITPRIVDGYGVIEARARVLPYVPGRYVFRYAAVHGEETLAAEEFTERLNAAVTVCQHRIIIPLPSRFRAGEENTPVLVRLTVLRAGFVCDDRLLSTGFHEPSFAVSPAMQMSLDGDRVFLAGVEWRGCEEALLPLYLMKKRLDALRRAHVNCLRVYGAEPDCFYDLLDRRGFLLWQVLPQDIGEAEAIIRRVRHRPSLIAYSVESVMEAFNRPAGLHHPTVRAIRDAVETQDGAHPFFGPIPGGPVASPGRDDLGSGLCVDVSGPAAYPGPDALCRYMNADDALIRTVACPAPALDLQALSGGEAFWPPDCALWAHRARGGLDLPALREWFDASLEEPSSAVRLTRALQAETIRYTVERARMRSSAASGVFAGHALDRLPSICSPALFDGDTPRPAYYALESALRPLHACARLDSMGYYCGTGFEATLCLLCDKIVIGPLTVRAGLYLPDGTLLAEASFDTPPETAEVGVLKATLPDYPCALTLRLTAERFGAVLDVNDYTICVALHSLLWPMAHAPFAAVRRAENTLANVCGQTALGITCDEWADAAFPGWGALLPGETRAFRQEKPIEGLNLEPLEE